MARLSAMNEQLHKGQVVTATAYGGEKLKRLVIADLGKRVLVCTEEEFHRAAQEKRQPDGIGFPRKDIRATTR